MLEVNKIIDGNVLDVLKTLPDDSIHCVITSPPYWALRDYKTIPQIWDGQPNCDHQWGEEIVVKQTGGDNGIAPEHNMKARKFSSSSSCNLCGAWKGNLGLEPTFDLFIKHLCDVFDEIKRVLRKDGSCYVNLGDSYSGNMGKRNGWTDNKMGFEKQEAIDNGTCLTNKTKINYSLPQKCLCNIPSRFAIEMTNRGWILRNKIIWHKPACMPSSARDRFTIDFEEILFFVKSKEYYFEQQFEPMKTLKIRDRKANFSVKDQNEDFVRSHQGNKDIIPNPSGRNKRCVWSINTKPFKEAHFATYPETLCETPILASCPEFVCEKCGKPRMKILENPYKFEWNREKEYLQKYESKYSEKSIIHNQSSSLGAYRNFLRERGYPETTTTLFKGYSDCGCNVGFKPGIVFDPFMGAGTTALVALKLNRQFLGIDLNPEYIKIAYERIKPYLTQTKLPNLNVQEVGTNG